MPHDEAGREGRGSHAPSVGTLGSTPSFPASVPGLGVEVPAVTTLQGHGLLAGRLSSTWRRRLLKALSWKCGGGTLPFLRSLLVRGGFEP